MSTQQSNTLQVLTKKLDDAIILGRESHTLEGFEKAYQLAEAAKTLDAALTAEYMKPILELQNKRIGYKTDKPNGYPEPVVKNCLIEAVLIGVQPVGNQFNIIASSCYITKEGFEYLLSHIRGLKWEIIPSLPRIGKENPDSGAVKMLIRWTTNGGEFEEREIDFAVKINKYMGTDAVIGKATRKARAWLHSAVTGNEISDGDVDTIDVTHTEVSGNDKKQQLRDNKNGTQGKINLP